MKQVDFYDAARAKWLTEDNLPNVPDVQVIVVERVNIPKDGPGYVSERPFVLQLRAVTATPYPFTFLTHGTGYGDEQELSAWPTVEAAIKYAKERNWTVVEE